jgi:hypothetical protein
MDVIVNVTAGGFHISFKFIIMLFIKLKVNFIGWIFVLLPTYECIIKII